MAKYMVKIAAEPVLVPTLAGDWPRIVKTGLLAQNYAGLPRLSGMISNSV